MIIYYKSKRLEKACNKLNESVREWGPVIAEKVRQRLTELDAAESLDDITHLPPARCHELSNNRAGQFSVDLKHPFRLIFEPANSPIPKKPNGEIDRCQITSVRIIEVVNYHDD